MVPNHKRRSFAAESPSSGPECSKDRITGVSEGVPSTPARRFFLPRRPDTALWTGRLSKEEECGEWQKSAG